MNKIEQRGQAVVETAISLPLYLLMLFTMFWAIKYAILSEHIESDARYTQQILDSGNIYTEYSIASLYDATSGTPRFMIVCAQPPSGLLLSSQPIVNNGITFPGLSLWTASSTIQSCSTDHQALFTSDGYESNLLLGFQTASIAATYSTTFGMSNVFAPMTLQSQSISNYQAASVADIELCYPELFSTVSSSLARGDALNSEELAVTPGSIEAAPSGETLTLDQACVGRGPKNASTSPASQTPPSAVGPNLIPSPATATIHG